MISRYLRSLNKSADYISKALLTKTPVVAYVSGFLGKQNLGDEALYLAAKQIFGRLTFVHYDSSRTLKLLLATVPAVRSGILAGGTLINRLPAWYDAAKEFYAFSHSLYVFGTGVANPDFWSGRACYVDMMDKWKALLEKCSFVGVRGPMSAEVLIEAGVTGVEVVGDPILAFAGSQYNHEYVPNSIGLNIGTANGVLWGNEDAVYGQFVKLANLAREAKWMVKWFVVWPEDLEITRRAANESKTADHLMEEYGDPFRYLREVNQVGAFVGMKLHATALATCAYVPAVMIEYQPKCRDYMKSIGQEESTIRTDQFKGEEVWEIAKAVNLDRQHRVEVLFANIQRLLCFQRAMAQEITRNILKLA